jgi:hypothetical protein
VHGQGAADRLDAALLDTVVQVPLDPAAHLIAGRHDAAAGGGQVGGEPLDQPLAFGQLSGVALGLLAERLFPRSGI